MASGQGSHWLIESPIGLSRFHRYAVYCSTRPVFREWHHQNTYASSNLLHTATSHCQRSNISLPKVRHLTAKGPTSHCQRSDISLPKVRHLTAKGPTSHCQRSDISLPKVRHLTANGATFQTFPLSWVNTVASTQIKSLESGKLHIF